MIATPLLLAALLPRAIPADDDAPRPNVVIVFCDDLGYGDLACYGHPTIRSPHLDRMAREGQRWTQFYVGSSVCTPSRAALLTGRLPIRSGLTSRRRRVLFPDSSGGIPASEVTLAEALKELGYATGMVGKWHLGHLPRYLPTEHGFDSYFGIPYSNDMDRVASAPEGRAAITEPEVDYFNVPLLRGAEVVERPADQTTITRRYTEEAVRFIEEHEDGDPFFLYLAHTMPHVPLFRSGDFEGASRRGLYGDVVEELDWSVGRVLDAIRGAGIADRTVVFFTSDNGPWLTYDEQGGSAGPLRSGKGSTWEGGMREPFLAWWPGTIPGGGVVHDLGATMDLFVTAILLAGGTPPIDRELDGVDLRPALFGAGPGPRESMIYYRDDELYAVRIGSFKAHFVTEEPYGSDTNRVEHDPPLLYHLEHDPGERFDVSADHPEVIAAIRRLADEHRATVEPVPNQLDGRIGEVEEADDLGRLRGTWRAEAGPTGEVIVTLSIDGDRFEQIVETSARSSFAFRGRLRLDESAEPRRLDWVDVTGPDGEPVPDAPAIYRLDGDDLTICSAAPGGDRPDGFAAARGRYPSLRSYRRVVSEAIEEEAVAGDLLAMQGDWSGGVGPGEALTAILSIRGRTARFVLVGPDGQEITAAEGRVEVDEAAEPRTMDWIPDGEGARAWLSLYELDGDALRVCLGLGRGGPGPRPEAFSDDFRTFTMTKATGPTAPEEARDAPGSDG